jgi:hypothetical protein
MPAADRTQPYAVQMGPVLERIGAFLGSRAQKVVLPILADGSGKSPIEFAPKQAHTTFNRRQVIAIVREVVSIMSEAPSPVAVRDQVPSYATGEKAVLKDMLPLLDISYTPTKGNSEGIPRNAALHCLGAYRRNIGRLAKRNAVLAKVEAGDAWFAEGVVDNKGVARAFPSEKKARKAWCRLTHGDNWYADDKAARLAAAVVYGQADSVGRNNQHAVNQHTTAVLEGMHHATVRKLARQAGAPTSATGSKAKAIQWFSDDITRMQGITL